MNLLEAVAKVDVPRVASLLFRGENVNVTDAAGVTPLMIACDRGACVVRSYGWRCVVSNSTVTANKKDERRRK